MIHDACFLHAAVLLPVRAGCCTKSYSSIGCMHACIHGDCTSIIVVVRLRSSRPHVTTGAAMPFLRSVNLFYLKRAPCNGFATARYYESFWVFSSTCTSPKNTSMLQEQERGRVLMLCCDAVTALLEPDRKQGRTFNASVRTQPCTDTKNVCCYRLYTSAKLVAGCIYKLVAGCIYREARRGEIRSTAAVL